MPESLQEGHLSADCVLKCFNMLQCVFLLCCVGGVLSHRWLLGIDHGGACEGSRRQLSRQPELKTFPAFIHSSDM